MRALIAGGGELLWEVDGEPVAQAAARAVVAGMSRIGPVYTPPEHRGHGYAAAVTAAAARWALERGARQVLLTNPVIGLPLQRGARAPSGWNSRGARPASSTTPSGPSPEQPGGKAANAR